jgi:hypothetical protein
VVHILKNIDGNSCCKVNSHHDFVGAVVYIWTAVVFGNNAVRCEAILLDLAIEFVCHRYYFRVVSHQAQNDSLHGSFLCVNCAYCCSAIATIFTSTSTSRPSFITSNKMSGR